MIDMDYKDTAIRETVEELGIHKERIIVEGRLDSVVTPSEFIIDIFIGRIELNNLDEFNINTLIDENSKLGYGIELTYRSFLGPISFGASRNTRDSYFRYYFSVGFSFNYSD